MSEANVELVRRGYEAVARGDFDAISALLAPDVKWHGGDASDPMACHNRDEALAFMRQARSRGGIGELVEVIDAGDQVVVVMRPASQASEEMELRANLTTFRDGKVIEMIAYESPADALAATRR